MSEIELVRLVLRVRDLDAVTAYYTDVLGLEVEHRDDHRAVLTLGAGRFGLELRADPEAPLRPYPCRGLYHFALLVPDRPALGAVLRRLQGARTSPEGVADHGVSEALYLRDPEGNGIELYRDRPREEWPVRDGELAMGADPLDVPGVLEAGPEPAPLHPETVVGHIHLHVDDLTEAERFYTEDLGMTVTQRSYRGALFFAWGDYHHHVGANVWAPTAEVDPAATGLLAYTVRGSSGVSEVLGSGRSLTDPVGAEVRLEAER